MANKQEIADSLNEALTYLEDGLDIIQGLWRVFEKDNSELGKRFRKLTTILEEVTLQDYAGEDCWEELISDYSYGEDEED